MGEDTPGAHHVGVREDEDGKQFQDGMVRVGGGGGEYMSEAQRRGGVEYLSDLEHVHDVEHVHDTEHDGYVTHDSSMQ